MSAHPALMTVMPMLTASTKPVALAVSARTVTSVMAATVKMLTSAPRTLMTVMPMPLASTLTVDSHALATLVSLATVPSAVMSMSAQ